MKKVVILLSLALVVIVVAIVVHNHMDRGRFTTEAVYTDLVRTVSDNKLFSPSDPNVVLQFDEAYRHIGGQKFVLYGVSDTEQHFFVETTPDNKLKSLYWVQFEAYQPSNDYTYDYDDSPLRLTLNNFEFYVDTSAVRPNPKNRRAGSDGSMARQLVGSRGYSYPEEFSYARLVYLTDSSKRKELMIIFIDDLADTGSTAAELEDEHAARWPEIEKQHLKKIRNTLTLISPQE